MWEAFKSLSFTNFLKTILAVLESFPPTFIVLVSAGIIILCALAIKRIFF